MERILRYDHYKVLGIPRDAPTALVKRAYRAQAKRWHPDRDPSPGAATVFLAVQDAYETLIDPDKRRDYDERLRYYRSAPAATQSPPTARDTAYHRSWKPPRMNEEIDEPDRPVQRFAYVGLHITGLLFGISLILSIALGVVHDLAPPWVVVFALPGVLAIPASIDGLRH